MAALAGAVLCTVTLHPFHTIPCYNHFASYTTLELGTSLYTTLCNSVTMLNAYTQMHIFGQRHERATWRRSLSQRKGVNLFVRRDSPSPKSYLL